MKTKVQRRLRFKVPSLIASRWKIILATVLVLGALGFYNVLIGDKVRDEKNNVVETPSMSAEGLSQYAGEDRLEVRFQVVEIDPVKEFMSVAYEPAPYGKYGYQTFESAYIASDFWIQYSSAAIGRNASEGIETEIAFQSNTFVGGWTAPINLFPCDSIDGSFSESETRGSAEYPNDGYCFDILLNTSEIVDEETVGFPSFLVQFGNGIDGYQITFERIPLLLTSFEIACADGSLCTPSAVVVDGREGACFGNDSCSVSEDLQNGYSRVRGFIERTEVVVLFSLIVLSTIVLAAVCAVAMTIAIATRIRPPALEGLAFLAGLLFAVQPLRGALPAAPPIGMDIDILVFYPSVLFILLSLVIQVGIWVRRSDYRT
jgi:hypothetical protein